MRKRQRISCKKLSATAPVPAAATALEKVVSQPQQQQLAQVVCGIRQLDALFLDEFNDEQPMPSMLHQEKFPPVECRNLVTLSSCLTWQNTLFCGAPCVAAMTLYTELHVMLGQAQHNMAKLVPVGAWKVTGYTRPGLDKYCIRCNVSTGMRHLQSQDSVEVHMYTNPQLMQQMMACGRGVDRGVCALCAKIVAKRQVAHQLITKRLPDGFRFIPAFQQHAPPPANAFRNSRDYNRALEAEAHSCTARVRSENCYNMPWVNQLAFCDNKDDSAEEAGRCCVECADANDARRRQASWDGAAHQLLLDLRQPTLPTDVVQLVGSYHLGKYFDSLSVYLE